jgi:GR25 family glycosyltransferase involved in LPS biosynthesis
MPNPFDFFSKKYCINLDCRKDRLKETSKLFEEYRIGNVERFKGIEIASETFPNENKKQLAQLGCALSFYQILNENRNSDSVLIFEDDICFNYNPEETEKYLNVFLEELPNNWDIFYLGNNLHIEYRNDPVSRFSDNLFRVNCAYALHAVVFSKQGIDKFLSLFNDREDFINEILSEYKAIDVFVAKEFLERANCYIGSKILAGQRDDFSSIENSRCRYNVDFVNRFEMFTKNL